MQNGNASKLIWAAATAVVTALVTAAAIGTPYLYVDSVADTAVTEHATGQHTTTVTGLSERRFETAAVDARVDVVENDIEHIKIGIDAISGKLDQLIEKK